MNVNICVGVLFHNLNMTKTVSQKELHRYRSEECDPQWKRSTFCVSSCVLNEFMRTNGTLQPYLLLRFWGWTIYCALRLGNIKEAVGQSNKRQWRTSIWITIRSRNVKPSRTSITDLHRKKQDISFFTSRLLDYVLHDCYAKKLQGAVHWLQFDAYIN